MVMEKARGIQRNDRKPDGVRINAFCMPGSLAICKRDIISPYGLPLAIIRVFANLSCDK
jgi:hypothetical protein